MERRETVLVTGGSGFLGGWCLVELLRRGYTARTTLRDPSREGEVRAMVGSQVEIGERMSVFTADLTADVGWQEAVAGCDYVLHVASPFPPVQPKDPDELIVPARDGTLRVLRASLDAGVRRIVLTSSVAAVRNAGAAPAGRELTEADWTDPENPRLSAYAIKDDRRAGGLGARAIAGRGGSARRGSARRDRRAGPRPGPLLLSPGDRAHAGRYARPTAAWLQLRRRT